MACFYFSIMVFQSSYCCLFQFKIIKKHISCILATCVRSWNCLKTGHVQQHRLLCQGKLSESVIQLKWLRFSRIFPLIWYSGGWYGQFCCPNSYSVRVEIHLEIGWVHFRLDFYHTHLTILSPQSLPACHWKICHPLHLVLTIHKTGWVNEDRLKMVSETT